MTTFNNSRKGQVGNFKFAKEYSTSLHEDAFENQIAQGVSNEADLNANYPYSQERYRLFKNGSRLFPEYNSVSEYSDLIDSHELAPAQGDVLKFRTAERFRYVVGFVIEPSFAFSLSRKPENDDVVVIGYGDADLENAALDQSIGPSADGWFFIFDSSTDDHQVKVEEYRGGTRVANKLAQLNRLQTVWKRLVMAINWYNVGRSSFYETYTQNGEQYNPLIADLTIDDAKGANSANKRVEFAIRRGSSTSDLTINVGSIGFKKYGNFDPLKRSKQGTLEFSAPDTADAWQPVAAFRKAPDKNLIETQFLSYDVLNFGGSDNLFTQLIAVDPANTDASGFATPSDQSSYDSTIEITKSVTTFPDIDGNVVSSANNPGGYQLILAGALSGTGQTRTQQLNSRSEIKKKLYEDDIVIALVRTTATGDTIIAYETEQDW